MERLEYEKEIFGMLFKVSNGLQVYLDRQLSQDKLTAKQMFLMIVVNTFGDDYPSLKQVAERSSSSYQNVKQLALKLEKAEYLKIELDPKDKRKRVLKLTDKARAYWYERDGQDEKQMTSLFAGCTDDALNECLKVIKQLALNIEKM